MNPFLYQEIVEGLQEGIVLLDLSGRVITSNRAASKMLGRGEESWKQRKFSELVSEAALGAVVQQLRHQNQEIEETFTFRGESEHQIKVFGKRIVGDADETSLLLVFSDVTHLSRLERVRRDFVANVSHELKTPITSIKASVETLLDGALDDRVDAERFLGMISRQSERLLEIVEDLLSLSRLQSDAGRFALQRTVCSIRAICSKALEVVHDQAAASDVKVELECPSRVEADVNIGLLQQALVNLLENAIKSCIDGGLVKIRVRDWADCLELVVVDNGCGISPDHLDRIFERFYRVDSGRGRDSGGSGLGLSIVKHIVQAHGGDVAVRSQVGAGSSFVIKLPKG